MKVFAKDEWYISLSDFWSEIKKAKIKIALVALLFAALFFCKTVKKTPTLSGRGDFSFIGNRTFIIKRAFSGSAN